ncbi:MAG: exodeoxyribonuclease VII large subunit [Bacteroidetes bacterium]|nr:exodeoxyribonuclease VII large subunit [Bacteroidota bacterium]
MQQPAPPKVYSLSQVAVSIRQALERATGNRSWLIRAEILKISAGLGQKTVYVDLVEESGGSQRAKMRGVIWPSNGARILETLGDEASTVLAPGSEMVFTARIEFHERYGLSLFIENVDLRHMLGEMERRKQATIARLKELGAFELNKRLPIPAAPQRIALVGSPGTSGFRDFIAKTLRHPSMRRLHIEAFASTVQGTAAPKALIDALQAAEAGAPDLIVLVRGGGSKLDLDCFNDFELCRKISLLGIPVWTGIGHESDLVVADLVAHSYWKTPTDVGDAVIRVLDHVTNEVHNLAAILERTVHRWLEDQQRELDQFGNEIQWSSQAIVRSHSNAMRTMEMQLNWHADRWLQSKNHVVESLAHQFDRQSRQVILQRRSELNNWMKAPFRSAQQQLLLQSERLQSMERSMASLHPEQTVKRGFAILSHQGQIIPDLIGLGPGDELEIQTRTGVARVTVQSIAPNDSKQKPEN